MKTTWMVTVLLLAKTSESLGARILFFQPTPARGHTIVTEPLVEELAARGHHLTVVTSYPHSSPITNLKEIDVSNETESKGWLNNLSVDVIKEAMPNQFISPIFMTETDLRICELTYSNEEVGKLLKSSEDFDLVITEIFTGDCFVPFAHRFKAPLMSIVTSCALPWASDRVGLPDNPAYIPNYFVDVGSEMSFSERVYNTIFLVYTKLVYYYHITPKTQELVDKYFGETLPSVTELVMNTSLILLNSYFSLTFSRPFTPNVIEVGGIHIRNKTASLPEDLQDILDRSRQGVLVVSFGSMVRVSSLPENVIKTFLASFSKIDQTVILKYEEELNDLPKNVIIRKWLPQREILEHKNVQAVLIHGGLASTMEAVYFGKPMIGVPFFSDQFLNIKTIERQGAGVMLDLDQISEQKLDYALQQVLNNPRFRERTRQLSEQFQDRPRSPLQTAVYWTEYVLRHRGAPQLRPASVDLRLWQTLLLDVAVFVLGVTLLVIYIVYFVISRALRHILLKSNVVHISKKKD